MLNYDVVIIGSGVAGMTAAIYLKRANISTLIIEEDTPGGQLNRSSSIENYPGFEFIDGPTLAYNIYNQVMKLECEYLFEDAIKVDFKKKLVTTNTKEIKYKYLIIATGRRPRKLNLDREKELIGKGVSYCALCDGNLYKNKEVAIIGGGNSAIEEANYLANLCKKVTVIQQSNKLSAEEQLIKSLKEKKNVDIIYNSTIKEYNLDNDKLVSVTLSNDKIIQTEGVFISVGYISSSEIFDVDKEKGSIITYDNYVTSNFSVYACGDIIKKNTYQITTAVGEATTVANTVIGLIRKNK